MTNPALATTTSDGRTYTVGGSIRPSATTILGILPKPGVFKSRENSIIDAALDTTLLQDLLAGEGEDAARDYLREQANKKRDAAGDIGSDVHHALDHRVTFGGWAAEYERYLFDGTIRCFSHESIRDYCAAFDAFLKEHEPRFVITEQTVYSDTHDYAGTMDAVMEIDGDYWFCDYKTGWVGESAAMQLAAYAYAEHIADPRLQEKWDAITPPFRGFVLGLKPDGFKCVVVKDMQQSFEDFLKVRAAYDVTRRRKSEVLARPAKRVA